MLWFTNLYFFVFSYTVPKKEATEFTREIGSKVDNNTLKTGKYTALKAVSLT